MITISLCMIVKNEEKTLERCLESISAGVDEIIIVDTGSDDKTKEIAAKFTDKIYNFEWIDDFSAARNFSFSKATQDFIMWLDADDVITNENLKKLINLKKTLSEDNDVIMMRYDTAFDENGNSTFHYYRERLIRRTLPHSWKGRVHETIENQGNIIYSEIAIFHRSVKTVYSDRNLKIYEKQEKDGVKFTPRDRFYFGRELYYHKHYKRAKKILSEFLEDKDGWTENKIEACKILSKCFEETGEKQKAANALTDSFFYDIPRAEICCDLGFLFFSMENYKIAIFWFETALSLPVESLSGAFIREECGNYLPCIMLCVCYDRLGDIKKAEEYNLRAGSFRPYSEAYKRNLEYFEKLKNTENIQ